MTCPICAGEGTVETSESATYDDKKIEVTYTRCSNCGTVLKKNTKETKVDGPKTG